jgi:hypothetical protein
MDSKPIKRGCSYDTEGGMHGHYKTVAARLFSAADSPEVGDSSENREQIFEETGTTGISSGCQRISVEAVLRDDQRLVKAGRLPGDTDP